MSLGLTVGLINKNNIFEWKILLVGANDTLYKLNIYTIKIEFPEIYPESPPKIFFLTRIYHPLVNPKKNEKYELGHIFDIFDGINWKNTSIRKALTNLFLLFYISNPNKINYEETSFITKEFIEDKELYEKKVNYFSKKYASESENLKDLKIKDGWDFSYNEIEVEKEIKTNNAENDRINNKDNKQNNDNFKNEKEKIILIFKEFGKDLEIECYEDELIKVVVKRYCDKVGIEEKDYFFIYNLEKLDYNKTIKIIGMFPQSIITVIYIGEFYFMKNN